MSIINCTSCNTKFRISIDIISSGKKHVRCSKCHHEWLVKKCDLIEESVDFLEKSFLKKEENNIDFDKHVISDEDVKKKNVHNTKEKQIKNDDLKKIEKKITKKYVTNINEGNKGFVSDILISIMYFVIVILVLYIVYFLFTANHSSIRKSFKSAEGIYKMFDIYPNENIKITDFEHSTEKVINNGKRYNNILFSVHLFNSADNEQYFSNIRVTLYDSHHNIVGTHEMNSTKILAPKKKIIINGGFDEMPLYTKYISVEVGNRNDLRIVNRQHIFQELLR